MSTQYDDYLSQHKANVKKGFDWIKENLPALITGDVDYEKQIGEDHDLSKYDPEEYDAYEAYFYGKNRSFGVVRNFRYAWLRHIHRNPHHWQHWILTNDDPKDGTVLLDMPYNYILEMVCDWWAFSWQKTDLYEIFRWYFKQNRYMRLSDKTRKTVEYILSTLETALLEKGLINPVKEEK